MATATDAGLMRTDFDNSGIVNFVDFSIFAMCWDYDCTTQQRGPTNLDGLNGVDWPDLRLFADYWLWSR
ncbi:MAG: hypothetical protein ACYS4W_03110 [Planctomycetota bacterium]|jgi:hypothetical protein